MGINLSAVFCTLISHATDVCMTSSAAGHIKHQVCKRQHL